MKKKLNNDNKIETIMIMTKANEVGDILTIILSILCEFSLEAEDYYG